MSIDQMPIGRPTPSSERRTIVPHKVENQSEERKYLSEYMQCYSCGFKLNRKGDTKCGACEIDNWDRRFK